MNVLVATNQTQGYDPGDYCWTVEGELVLAEATAECCNPRCGCERGFPGLASSRATTTALVSDRPDWSRADLASAIEAGLDRQGWLKWLDLDEQRELIDDQVELIELVTSGLPAGTVSPGRAPHIASARRQRRDGPAPTVSACRSAPDAPSP